MGIRKRPIRIIRAVMSGSKKTRVVIAEFVLSAPIYLKTDEWLAIETE